MVLVKMRSVWVRFETFVVSGESSTISDGCNYFKLIMQNDKKTKGNWIVTPCYHLVVTRTIEKLQVLQPTLNLET